MRRGFTLIEIIIALGVMLVLLTAAASGLSNANRRQSLDQVTENVRQAFLLAKSYAQAGKKDCLACGGTAACEVSDAPLDGWRVTVNASSYVIEGWCGGPTPFYSRQYDLPNYTLVANPGSVMFRPIGLGTDLGSTMYVAIYRSSGTAEVESFGVEPSGELSGVTVTMSTPTPAPTATWTPTPGATSTPTPPLTPTPTSSVPGPVVWWKLDENTGTSANDSSGNGVIGTLSGNAAWIGGKYGSAVAFDGSADYVQSGDASVLDISGTSPVTVEAWINVSQYPGTDACPVIITETGYASSSFDKGLRVSSAGVAVFYVWDGSAESTNSTTTLSLGTWYHIAGVFLGANSTRIYVNGVLEASGTTAASTFDYVSPQLVLSHARGSGSRCVNDFNGMVDDVRIYNYIRTPAQIALDMNGGSVEPTATPTSVAATPTPTPTPVPTCAVTTVTAPAIMTIGGACTSWEVSAVPSSGTVSSVTFTTGNTTIATVTSPVTTSPYSTTVCPGGGPAGSTTLTASCLISGISRGIDATTATLAAGPTPTPTRTPTPVPPTPTPTSSVPGPVVWWKLDENTGTSANDSSGNGVTGTLSGNAAWSGGQYGGAVTFDGSADYVQSGAAAVLDISGTSPVTVEAWINVSQYPGADACPVMMTETGYASTTLDKGFRVSPAGNVAFYVWDGTEENTSSTTALSLNTWYHIAGVFLGTNSTRIYVNGVLEASGTTAASTFDFASPQLVLSHKASSGSRCVNDFNGMVDDVRIYNYIRTPAQIALDRDNL